MKILAAVMALFAVIYFLPAFTSRTDELASGSRPAVYKSAVKVKRYLPTDERVVFDTALGILDKIKSEEGPDAFVAAVGGKTPDEVIALAKQEVTVKIAAGHPDFKKYTSWENMVEVLTEGEAKKPSNGAEAREAQPIRNSTRESRSHIYSPARPGLPPRFTPPLHPPAPDAAPSGKAARGAPR